MIVPPCGLDGPPDCKLSEVKSKLSPKVKDPHGQNQAGWGARGAAPLPALFREIIAGMPREIPYRQFNYLLQFAGESGTQAGFQECSGLGLEVGLAEYRDGNEPPERGSRITGTHKVPDVTLKRGVIGEASLSAWLEESRSGVNAQREAVLVLRSEDRTQTLQTWTLSGTRIVKCTGDLLNSQETQVALEELVLKCERIEGG
jgi:phage tail-like protein